MMFWKRQKFWDRKQTSAYLGLEMTTTGHTGIWGGWNCSIWLYGHMSLSQLAKVCTRKREFYCYSSVKSTCVWLLPHACNIPCGISEPLELITLYSCLLNNLEGRDTYIQLGPIPVENHRKTTSLTSAAFKRLGFNSFHLYILNSQNQS